MTFGVEDVRVVLKDFAERKGAAWVGRWLEIATERFYTSVLNEGDFAVDIGANRARHTVPMARLLGEGGKLLAIEAAKGTALKLERDIRVANLPYPKIVEIGRFAVADYTGTATFTYFPSATGLSGLKSEELSEKWPDMTSEEVEVKRLDDVVPAGRAIRFIKLDIEGAELSALRGATRILANDRPPLAFENGGLRYARRFNYTSADFFGFFEQMKYRLYTPLCTPFGPDWDSGMQPGQLFALPAEQAPEIVTGLAPAMVQAMAEAFASET